MRIFLLDDHQLFRAGLRLLLQRAAGLTVVGEAGDGASALAQVGELNPDIAVVDVHLPDGVDGIEVARGIQERCPAARIVFLSSDSDFALVRRAIEAGGRGYLLKENAPQDLMRALQAVEAGGVYLSPGVASALVDDYRLRLDDSPAPAKPKLSDREREVLMLLAEGLRNKEIAARLAVGVKSVETYRSRLLAKLKISSTAELVRYAVREGLIKP